MYIQEGKEYYSVAEIAEDLCRSRITVFRYIKEGKLKAKKSGRNYVIAYSDYISYFFRNEMTKEFRDKFTELTLKLLDDIRGT